MIRLLLIPLILIGCSGGGGSGDDPVGGLGGSACAQSLAIGSWRTQFAGAIDNIEISANCIGTSNICDSSFRVPNIEEEDGIGEIEVLTTNGLNGCLPVGTYQCSYLYESEPEALSYFCGSYTVRLVR